MNSINSSHIDDILEDQEGNLWVATYKRGLNNFNDFVATGNKGSVKKGL